MASSLEKTPDGDLSFFKLIINQLQISLNRPTFNFQWLLRKKVVERHCLMFIVTNLKLILVKPLCL